MDKNIVQLSDRQEAAGKLKGINHSNNFLLLHLSVEYRVKISDQKKIEDQLTKLVGKNISVLRLDDHYYVKEKREESK